MIAIVVSMLLLVDACFRAHLRRRSQLPNQVDVWRVVRPAASGMRVVSDRVPEVD